MKKIIKNPIFTFILGSIIFSSVTVLASQILARDIEYTKDGVTTDVESALNDLYDKASADKIVHLDVNQNSTYYTFTKNYKTIYLSVFRGPDEPIIKVNDTTQNYMIRREHSNWSIYIYKLENIVKDDILYHAGFVDLFTVE